MVVERRRDHGTRPGRFRGRLYAGRIEYKPRRIVAIWNRDVDSVVRSFILVIFGQPLPEPVGLHPNDGIPLLVKVGRTPKRLHGDGVFFQIVYGALEVPGRDVDEQLLQPRRPAEGSRLENCFDFLPFFEKASSDRHDSLPVELYASQHMAAIVPIRLCFSAVTGRIVH